jgi:signal transduction histidine kinase
MSQDGSQHRAAPVTRTSRFRPALVLCGSLLLSILLTVVVYTSVEERARARFELSVDDAVDRVAARLQGVQDLLTGTRALFAASATGEVTREEFRRYVGGLEVGHSGGAAGIEGIGYAPAREERGQLASTIQYLEPDNDAARGLYGSDMLTDPVRRAAMLRARDRGRAALSAKVRSDEVTDATADDEEAALRRLRTVAKPDEGDAAFVLFLPLYAGTAPPTDEAARRASLRGFLFARLKADELFADVFAGDPVPVTFRLYDGEKVKTGALLHDSARVLRAQGKATGGELHAQRSLNVAGQPWRFAFSSRPGFVSSFERSLPGWLGLLGVSVSFLLYRLARAEQRARDLAEARQREAERVNRELDQFAYAASHDLKAPLRGIASLAHWLEEDLGDRLTESARKQLALMQGRVVRLESLIEGLLKYARAGRVGSAPERVDVGVLVTEVVALLDPPAEAVVSVAPSMPTLETERAPLEQVFMNLVANALKYAGKSNPHIDVDCSDEGSYWSFSVRDDGPGIEPAFHERVFGMFQTLQPRDRVESPGIGLAVVRKVVEARGGRTWVDSQGSGEGATFHFTWPKREPVAALAASAEA